MNCYEQIQWNFRTKVPLSFVRTDVRIASLTPLAVLPGEVRIEHDEKSDNTW